VAGAVHGAEAFDAGVEVGFGDRRRCCGRGGFDEAAQDVDERFAGAALVMGFEVGEGLGEIGVRAVKSNAVGRLGTSRLR
jgi:hypothetical protein